jgi:hypothetical protein
MHGVQVSVSGGDERGSAKAHDEGQSTSPTLPFLKLKRSVECLRICVWK